MTFLFLEILGLMALAAGFGAWLARWFFRHRYEDVTVQYQGWQSEWAQWRKGLDSKLSLRQMLDLSPVTERIAELEALMRGYSMPKPAPVDLAPVLKAVGDIKLPESPKFDFTPLYSRMYDVEQRVASIRIPQPPDLKPLHDRLDALEAALAHRVAAIHIPEPDFGPTLTRLGAIEVSVQELQRLSRAGEETVVAEFRPLHARVDDVRRAVQAIPIDFAPILGGVGAVDQRVLAVDEQVALVGRRVQEVEARVREVDARVLGVDSRVQELDRRAQSTDEKVAHVAHRVDDVDRNVAGVDQHLGGVEQRVMGADQRIGALVEEHSGGVQQRIGNLDLRVGAVAQRLDSVDELMTGVGQRVAAVDGRVGNVDQRVAAVGQRVGDVDQRLVDVGQFIVGVSEKVASVDQTVASSVGDVRDQVAALRIPDLAPVMTGLAAVVDTHRADLAPLYGRVAEVEKAVHALPKPEPVDFTPVLEHVAGVGARVEAMDQRIGQRVEQVGQQVVAVDRRVQGVGEFVAGVEKKVAGVDQRIVGVDQRVAGVDEKVADVGLRVVGVDGRVEAIRIPPPPSLEPVAEKLDALDRAIAAIRIPEPPPPPDIAPLAQRVDAVGAAIAGLRVPAPTDLAPLQRQLDAVGQAVGAIRMPAPPSFEPLMQRVGAIEPRLAAIETRVAAFKPPEATPRIDLAPMQARLDSLAQAVSGIRMPTLPPPAAPATVDLSPLVKRLSALEARMGDFRSPAPPVDLSPVLERLRAIESTMASLGRHDTPSASRSAPHASAAAAAAPSATAKAAVASAQSELGLANSGHVREGSRNLLTHEAYGPADDLKDIVGVAEGLEKTLHRLGVFYFWQIADWTPQDITYVDGQLTGFKGRIRRENWVGQCRKLAAAAGAARRPG